MKDLIGQHAGYTTQLAYFTMSLRTKLTIAVTKTKNHARNALSC